jgi:hypothetical protein
MGKTNGGRVIMEIIDIKQLERIENLLDEKDTILSRISEKLGGD